jgi:hypothetical protein
MQPQAPDERLQLITAIKKEKCLLLIAAYPDPLQVDVHSRSRHLAAALAKLQDAPLATLRYDPLLILLKSEDDSDYLVGMSSALDWKRDDSREDV